jgi:hypothetical protein
MATIHPLDAVHCDGCGNVTFAWTNPCMPCVKARAHVATRGRGRCSCPKRLRRETGIKSNGLGRTWISCERCLGTVRQVS